MMERSERADPSAEDATEDQREREEADAPEKAAVDGVRRERGHRRDERIGEQVRFDRKRESHRLIRARGERSAERRLKKKVHEEREEPDLRDAADPLQSADALARGDAAARATSDRSSSGRGAASGRTDAPVAGATESRRRRSRDGVVERASTRPTFPFHGIGFDFGHGLKPPYRRFSQYIVPMPRSCAIFKYARLSRCWPMSVHAYASAAT